MDSLNVCVGIDAGSYESKLAYSDELSTRIIARVPGFDLNALREEAEAFFDEPIFSCVAAVNMRAKTKDTGFTNIDEITQSEAIIFALEDESRKIVYDFGESSSRIYVIDAHEVLDKIIIEDVCGKIINKNFAEYLCERYSLDAKDANILSEAQRIKHALSIEGYAIWRELKIYRDELERIIHFPVKRAARIIHRLMRVHKPEKIILTGGSIKIPEVWHVISAVLGTKPEYRGNIIAEGAASKARDIQRSTRKNKKPDTAVKIRELRNGMLELEERLTRRQKDRVYAMFRQAEGINDAGIIALMENLLREIRNA